MNASLQERVAVDRWMAEHGVLDFPTYQCVDCLRFFNRKDQLCHCRADVRMVHEAEIVLGLEAKVA